MSTVIAELRDWQTLPLPSCGTDGHYQVARLMDIAELQDRWTLKKLGTSCRTDGHCQVVGFTDIANLRDRRTLLS